MFFGARKFEWRGGTYANLTNEDPKGEHRGNTQKKNVGWCPTWPWNVVEGDVDDDDAIVPLAR